MAWIPATGPFCRIARCGRVDSGLGWIKIFKKLISFFILPRIIQIFLFSPKIPLFLFLKTHFWEIEGRGKSRTFPVGHSQPSQTSGPTHRLFGIIWIFWINLFGAVENNEGIGLSFHKKGGQFFSNEGNMHQQREFGPGNNFVAPLIWKKHPFPPQFPSLYFLFPFSRTLCEWAQFSGDQCFLRGNGHNKKYSPTLVRLSSAPGRFSQHSATSSRLDCVLGRGPGLRLHKGIPQFLFCSFLFFPIKITTSIQAPDFGGLLRCWIPGIGLDHLVDCRLGRSSNPKAKFELKMAFYGNCNRKGFWKQFWMEWKIGGQFCLSVGGRITSKSWGIECSCK